jgi:DNA-binding NarL/FixJ family response regulator
MAKERVSASSLSAYDRRARDPRAPAPVRKNRTILIGSPQSTLRRRWRRGLTGTFAVQEVDTYSKLEASIARLKPDALILDVSLLPVDGIDAVRRWNLATRVLLLGGEPTAVAARSALKAAARRHAEGDDVPSLVSKAVGLAEESTAAIGEAVAVPLRKGLSGLTSREREVALLVGLGARNKEIARRLRITEATVKAHLTMVFRKLELQGRLHLGLVMAGQAPEFHRSSGIDR